MLVLGSVLALAATVLLALRSGTTRVSRLFLAFGLVLQVLLLLVYAGLNAVTGKGVDDSVLYHMQTGLGGGDISQYIPLIAGLGLAFGLAAVSAWLLSRWLSRRQAARTTDPALSHPPRWANIGIFGGLALALMLNPFVTDVAVLLQRQHMVPQQTEGFVEPTLTASPARKKNLVLIYLESVERTYLDEARFPDLTPNLRRLETMGQSFTNIGQSAGAGFTIGGMVAGQCGVPLLTTGSENSLQTSRFLAGATCLGDLLAAEGYHTEYMGGASAEFAGKGSFYESHSFDRISDLNTLRPMLEDPAYLGPWGLQDDSLFALARARLEELAAAPDPFAFVMLTLDTHHPDGHANTNRSCQDVVYGDGSNPMLTSVKCTDKLAAAFVQSLLDSPMAKDTLIVLASDHLAMQNTATDLLNAGPRRNFLVLLNPDLPPGASARAGSTLDAGPTILSALGYPMPAMGFGVDLNGALPSLADRFPIPDKSYDLFADHLAGYRTTFTRLWDYPKLNDGFYVNVEGGFAQFGPASFKLPAVMLLDDQGAIADVIMSEREAQKSLPERVLEAGGGQPLLWFDTCDKIAPVMEEAADQSPLCLLSGKLGHSSLKMTRFKRSSFVSPESLSKVVIPQDDAESTAQPDDPALLASRHDALTRYLTSIGARAERLAFAPDGYQGRDILLRSAGSGQGQSLVRLQEFETLESGIDKVIETRGLNLVGIGADGMANLISHRDTCEPNAEKDGPVFGAAMEAAKDQAVAFFVIGHDSVLCNQNRGPIDAAVAGLSLPQLAQIGFRQPYVALIDPAGTVTERVGQSEQRITLHLSPTEPAPKAETDVSTAPAVPVETAGAATLSSPAGDPPETAKARPTEPPAPTTLSTAANALTVSPAFAAAPVLVAQPEPSPAPAVTAAALADLPPPVPTGCIQPTLSPPAPMNQQPFPLNTTFAISSVQQQDVFAPLHGWWDPEPFGHWIGAARADFSILLPTDAAGAKSLQVLAAPAGGTETELDLSWNGRPLGRSMASANKPAVFDVSSLPLGTPLVLTLSTPTLALDCPLSRGAASDPRVLTIMMQSIALVTGSSPSLAPMSPAPVTPAPVPLAPVVQTTVPAAVVAAPPAPAAMAPMAIAPPPAPAAGPAQQTPRPVESRSALPDAGCFMPDPATQSLPTSPLSPKTVTSFGTEGDAIIGFGNGWWEPEDFGRWIGAASANFLITLPEGREGLDLRLDGSIFGATETRMDLRFRDQLLFSGAFGSAASAVFDTADLPRGEPIVLHIGFPDAFLTCPAAQGTGADARVLIAMITAVTAVPNGKTVLPRRANIAHAGGEYAQTRVTNSLDALNANSPRYSLFEIDLSWTADDQLVCLHDWEDSFAYRFGPDAKGPLTLADFERDLAATVPDRPENCTLATLARWLKENPSKRVVTDVKDENLKALTLIAQTYPDLRNRLIPQAYQPEDITAIRDLGFPEVIWTLYRYGGSDDEVLALLPDLPLYALTMTEDHARRGLGKRAAETAGVPSYVHTINDPVMARCYAKLGISAVYTDVIGSDTPAENPANPDTCPPV